MHIARQQVTLLHRACVATAKRRIPPGQWRSLTTLAIESSCDDSSVAVLEKVDRDERLRLDRSPRVEIIFHEKRTSNNLRYNGVHPVVALQSHQRNVAHLVTSAIAELRKRQNDVLKPPVDFISVTRGPGMRSCLDVGLNTAKGLSAAWGVPLLAVNHLQAHALTPRLASAMVDDPSAAEDCAPRFPFLSLLVSGGHTMLIHSKSLCDHPTLAVTSDIAIGDAIDKIARDTLPPEVLARAETTMYGPLLERFAFEMIAGTEPRYGYEAPMKMSDLTQKRVTRWGWALNPPLILAGGGQKMKSMEFSFSGLVSNVKHVVDNRSAAGGMEVEERRELAREAMRVAFEHLASRTVLALEEQSRRRTATGDGGETALSSLVVSGGVAANKFLRHLFRCYLDAQGYGSVKLIFPPAPLCTDNAAMIGWAGIEMYEAGWRSDLGCEPLRKWALDPAAADGGILGVNGWLRLDGARP